MEIRIKIKGANCLDEGGRICPEFRMWLCDKFGCKLKPDNHGFCVRCPQCLALDKKEDEQEDLTEWDNNCALTAKREKEER